ncbi:MAG: hypothetical protein LBB09_03715, partial [Rickettsiales bacterium]|nr:hypothetical protein [Rickettsiales bacterium]
FRINDLGKFRKFINEYCDRPLLELQHLWTNYKGNNKEASYGIICYVIINIDNLFKKSRINLLYFPPYSPDLNPIEKK